MVAVVVHEVVPVVLRSAAIVWISCVTTHNFSNCDSSYNNNQLCWSLSYNKSGLEILSWPS